MDRIVRIYDRLVTAVAAAMLAAIFAVFLYQIVARYILGLSVGWTIELNLTLWLWLVLFSCAFVLRERDHVKFDLLYSHVGDRPRRVFAVLSALAIVGALGAAMADTWDYVDFYKIKKSATLRWPLNEVFSIYLVFAVAIVARYAWRAVALVRGRDLSLDERDIRAD